VFRFEGRELAVVGFTAFYVDAGLDLNFHSMVVQYMDLSKYTKKSGKAYPMPSSRVCIVCQRSISKDETPRHLFYSSFCSEDCKDKYVRPL